MADRAILPMASKDLETWKGELSAARELRKRAFPWWDANLRAYAPQLTDDPMAYGSTLNTNRDFTLVERKKADLFYQQPDVEAIPSQLSEDQNQRATLEIHTAILNAKLGLNGVDVKDLYARQLFDVLCPTGTGFAVMGYESATVPVQQEQVIGQQPQPGAILGLGATTPITQTVEVPVPVFEDFFWRYLSPRQMLIPSGFRSTRWDDAPYLGYDFEWPLAVAKSRGWVPSDFTGGASQNELYFDYGMGRQLPASVVRGSVVWYKSQLYRPERPHPQHLTLLIFIDGIDLPVEHKDSPYQTLDQTGKLTPDSMIGFPIHPLTIRVLSDAPMVPSDCTVSRPLVNELNRFRGQMVEQRDAMILRYVYNTDILPTDALSKFVRAPIGGMIGLPGEAYVGEGAIKELPHGSFPRENFQFNDYLDQDLARTHALDANQAGVQAPGDQTATEASLRQTNANARLGFERGVVLDHYLKGIAKYSTLLQRFLSAEDAAQIVGPQKAQQWDAWRHTVPPSVAFTAMPDAALRHDLAYEQKRVLDEYTYFANDPNIDRRALLQHIAPKLHLPESVILPQPPQRPPEPSKPSFTFKGDDLNPLNPQFPIVMQILQQGGFQIDPTAVQEAQSGAMNQVLAQQVPANATGHPAAMPAQQTHGGKVAQMESLSKHQSEQTGGMNKTGDVLAGNPGSVM